MRILVLQGPNLHALGTREPAMYGTTTLAEIQARLDTVATGLGVSLEHFQSDHEGVLVERVHRAAAEKLDGAVINAAAYTHTSIALRDALIATALPFVEVHVSNVFARESFRHQSLIADLAKGVVVGFGPAGYELALSGLVGRLS